MTRRIRFSGALRIAIALLDLESPDGRSRYAVRVTVRGDRATLPWTAEICGPAWTSEPSDSPETFSKIAETALAFADHEGFPVESYGDFAEEGYAVSPRP